MTSIIKTDEIQSQNGGAVVKMQTLKHPSASGNSITLASDGSATIANGTITAGSLGSSVVVPASIGGSLVYLESTSGTNVSSIAFENKFSSTDYIQYIIEFQFKPTTDDRHIHAEIGTGGASTSYKTGSYRTVATESYYGGSNNLHHRTASGIAMISTGVGSSTTDGGIVGTYYLIQPYNTTRYKMNRYNLQKWEQNDHLSNGSGGSIWYGGTDAITAIKFFAFDYTGGGSHGNITGEARMYGLKAS